MKKLFALVLVLVLALSLVACGGSGVKDGTYTAEYSDAYAEENGHGWKDTLTVTYKSGKITDVVFESFNAEGAKKSESTPETYPMDPAPTVWMPQIAENVKSAGSSDKFAAIAGATGSSDNAKALFAAIEKAAAEGKTETIVLEA